MSKIIGNTTTTPVPRSDWSQTDKTKADFIRHKPELGAIAEKDVVDKADLTADVQSSLEQIDTKASVVALTTAEYEALEETNTNTLYMLTDSDEDGYYTTTEVDEKIDEVSSTLSSLSGTVTTNYNETIIGLSVDGTTVTYIKGDGSVHTFETQDTNTTYSLGTDEATGLTKLYATTGSAEDGTMTQKAIKTELDKKVGVAVDDSQNILIFTI